MADFPVVLCSEDFGKKEKVFYLDECDCACASVVHPTTSSLGGANTIYEADNCIRVNLPDAYTFMLNPLSTQHGAVLNAAAQDLWKTFRSPYDVSFGTSYTKEGVCLVARQKMLEAGLLGRSAERTSASQDEVLTLGVWMHMTNACNLHCDYCYLQHTKKTMDEETGRSSVDAIIRAACNNGFQRIKLKFAGGEPTLVWEHVLALQRYAEAQASQVGLELETVVLSNGVSLEAHMISALKARGMRVMISLDGIGPMHDVQRKFADGRGSFAFVARTLDQLYTAGIQPFISITVSDRNARGLAEITRYVLERNLPFNFNFFRDNLCATGHPDLKLHQVPMIQGIYDAFAVIEANLPGHSLLGGLVDRSQFDYPHTKACGVGQSYLVIDPQGNIAKCQMTLDQPVTTIYADDPLADLRNDRSGLQNLSVDEKEDCRDCQWRYWCAGGCPLLTYRTTGRYDVKSPYCEIYKAIYPELLRLEGLRIMKLAKVGPFG